MAIHPLDLAIAGILIAGFIWGFTRGFVSMFFSLLALVGGVLAASKLVPVILPHLFNEKNAQLGYIILYVILFTLVYFIVKKLTYLFEDMVEFLELEWLDSLLGGGVGLAQFLIIAGVLLSVAQATGLYQLIPNAQESRIAGLLTTSTQQFIVFLSGSLPNTRVQ